MASGADERAPTTEAQLYLRKAAPLAHLALWIEHGSEYDNTDAHKWDYWPSLAERRAKRGEIMSAPEWAALLARERPKRIDEPDEPDDIV